MSAEPRDAAIQNDVDISTRAVGGGMPTASFSQEPLPHAPQLEGKSCVDTSTQSTLSQLQSFSPKLCLELLPTLTPEQMDYEISWQKSVYGHELNFRLRKPDNNTKMAELCKAITPSISIDNSQIFYDCEKYQDLTRDFACLLTRAESYIKKLGVDRQGDVDEGERFFDTVDSQEDLAQVESEDNSTDPVRVLDLSFQDIEIGTILECFDMKKVGSRKVGYIGSTEYQYGGIRHPPTPYPSNQILDGIFDELRNCLQDPEITKDNFSTMATLYETGTDWLPYHSDDEEHIAHDSNIITISLGATREVKFRSITGTVRELTLPLPHGCVHVMTKLSQEHWEHCIPKHSTEEKRLSLTFRRLSQGASSQPPPPIQRPTSVPPPIEDPTPTPAQEQSRILFLTDSIHKSFPVENFPEHSKIQCIKRVNWELHKIDKYEHLFNQSDIVFISCGINDLSRYSNKFNAENLIYFLRSKLNVWKTKYPDTKFVLNSLLCTRFNWLNVEIKKYNRMLFELSMDYYCQGVYYFDSWNIARDLWNKNFYVLNPNGNGIHIHHRASQTIHKCVIENIVKLKVGGFEGSGQSWPIRKEFLPAIEQRRNNHQL